MAWPEVASALGSCMSQDRSTGGTDAAGWRQMEVDQCEVHNLQTQICSAKWRMEWGCACLQSFPTEKELIKMEMQRFWVSLAVKNE